MKQFMVGLLMMAAGFLMIWKSRWFREFLDESAFATKYFSGGTYTLVKIIGVLSIVAGFLVIADLHESIIDAIF